MRKVVSYLLISLDGVVESPDRWVFDSFDAEMLANLESLIASQDAVLLGRVTYQEWATYWPTSTHEPFASFINATPKYVASTELDEVHWSNSTLLQRNLAEQITSLKGKPGKDIGVHGSAGLVRFLLRHGLIDELLLAVVPVIAGRGRRLFTTEDSARRMELAAARQTSSGVMLLTYRPRAS